MLISQLMNSCAGALTAPTAAKLQTVVWPNLSVTDAGCKMNTSVVIVTDAGGVISFHLTVFLFLRWTQFNK